ncbi:MAG: hypothetical protein R3A11_00265 [Bdellovibrionota bacterium]
MKAMDVTKILVLTLSTQFWIACGNIPSNQEDPNRLQTQSVENLSFSVYSNDGSGNFNEDQGSLIEMFSRVLSGGAGWSKTAYKNDSGGAGWARVYSGGAGWGKAYSDQSGGAGWAMAVDHSDDEWFAYPESAPQSVVMLQGICSGCNTIQIEADGVIMSINVDSDGNFIVAMNALESASEIQFSLLPDGNSDNEKLEVKLMTP